MNTYGSPKYVVIYLEDIVYPGGYKSQLVVENTNLREKPLFSRQKEFNKLL